MIILIQGVGIPDDEYTTDIGQVPISYVYTMYIHKIGIPDAFGQGHTKLERYIA